MAITRRSIAEQKGKSSVEKTEENGRISPDENSEAIATSTDAEPGKHKITRRKILLRMALCSAVIFMVYVRGPEDPKPFVAQTEKIQFRSHEVECSKSYSEEIAKYPSCIPSRCGRVVTDDIITPHESFELLRLAKKGLALGGAFGGASILDIHSGALSKGEHFINVYQHMKENNITSIFSHQSFEIYRAVKNKIQRMIALHFGLRAKNIYLTHPTFFSRMQNTPPRTKHDEYWHVHIDKETYESFHYTSILYLSDYKVDFEGGQFQFVDYATNMTVEPKVGRVLAFTSGAENPHNVQKIIGTGKRFALTVSFTCDKTKAIVSPTVAKLKTKI